MTHTCKWCNGDVVDTVNPYGARHLEPVCEEFKASFDTIRMPESCPPIKVLDDRSGWYFEGPAKAS